MSRKSRSKTQPKRLHLRYQGRVQGVGFRFTVEGIALRLGLTGWVKNLPNGEVEVLAEGDEGKLIDLQAEVRKSAVGKHIQHEIVQWQVFESEFSDFRIEFFG